MNIFETPQINKAEQEAINLSTKSKVGLDMLKSNYEDSFMTLWANPNATPQEILDLYGTNASQLFVVSRATAMFIKSVDPSWTPPVSPKEFTINEDGTVTIIE
jgi:hypothetical protein